MSCGWSRSATGRFSRELCGGTHVQNTAELGLFRMLHETSSAANVRRIEAITGPEAVGLARTRDRELERTAELLRVPPERVAETAEELRGRVRELERAAKRGGGGNGAVDIEALIGSARESGGVTVLTAAVSAADGDALLQILDRLKGRLDDAAIVLGAAGEGRVDLVASVAPSLVQRGRQGRRDRQDRRPGGGRRRRRARHAGAGRRTRSRAAAGGDRGRSGRRSRPRWGPARHDASAGARLRSSSLWMRGERPHRSAGHAAWPSCRLRPPGEGSGGCARWWLSSGAERVVVGLPLSLSGADSAQTVETRAFAHRLRGGAAGARRALRRALHDAPGRAYRRRADEDSRAAAHLLDSWLASTAAGSARG